MRKTLICLAAFSIGCVLLAQSTQHEVAVTSVEVPVWVYSGDEFVKDLTREDFELLEDGVAQTIDSVYLIKGNQVEGEQDGTPFSPELARHFFFLFQVTNYDARFKAMMDYFFDSVLKPDDTLTLMTTMGTYNLSKKALRIKPRERISRDMQGVVRRDATVGSADYNSLLQDLTRLVRGISAAGGVTGEARMNTTLEGDAMQGQFSDSQNVGFLLGSYRSTLEKLEGLRMFEEKKVLGFADTLKRTPGQKIVFFIYEREFRPEINDSVLGQMMQRFQDEPNVLGDLQDLFQFYQRHVTMDRERLARVFADTSSLFHFIFINRDPGNASGIRMREQSEDVFSTFSEIAHATGGKIDNSQNPAHAFQTAYEATETHYLLYYTPAGERSDPGFRTLTVRVKSRDFRVTHRRGYIGR